MLASLSLVASPVSSTDISPHVTLITTESSFRSPVRSSGGWSTNQVDVPDGLSLEVVRHLGRLRAAVNQDGNGTSLDEDGVPLPHVDEVHP